MCGLFGFIAKGEARMDLVQLKRIATITMSRGQDAFGFAWIDREGRLRMYKQTGRIVDSLGLLAMAKDARMMLGHCRWATQGSPANNLNNHPHPADGGWIVHNGVIPDYRGAVRDFRFHPVTQCDTELLGLMIERLGGTMVRRCVEATGLADGRALVLGGLWNRPNRLVLVRRGNPLHTGIEREGTYFASLSDDLPGDVESVPDESVLEFCGRKVNRTAI